jgi:hypothetical protein
MGRLRQFYLNCVTEISWRIPGRPAQILAQFAQAERGSAYDMLAAAELTDRRELRRKYLEHALDEAAHAKVFRDRAQALGMDREGSAMIDIGCLHEHGIVGGETLFERLGELDFLAFVHLAESQALEQFQVYKNQKLVDPETQAQLDQIRKDELFHMTYSGAELDWYRKAGLSKEVRRAIWGVHWRRFKEQWLAFSRRVGDFVSGIWLLLMYTFVVGPFRLLARPEDVGWQSCETKETDLAAARAQF